jgi:hypothetical protein
LVRRRRSRIDGKKLPPQLGDLQLDIAGLGRQQRITGAVAPIRPSIGTFVALGADHFGRLGVDQRLQHEFDTRADDIDIATGADRVQSVGHVRLCKGHRETPFSEHLAVQPKISR